MLHSLVCYTLLVFWEKPFQLPFFLFSVIFVKELLISVTCELHPSPHLLYPPMLNLKLTCLEGVGRGGERRGPWKFLSHILLSLSSSVHLPLYATLKLEVNLTRLEQIEAVNGWVQLYRASALKMCSVWLTNTIHWVRDSNWLIGFFWFLQHRNNVETGDATMWAFGVLRLLRKNHSHTAAKWEDQKPLRWMSPSIWKRWADNKCRHAQINQQFRSNLR